MYSKPFADYCKIVRALSTSISLNIGHLDPVRSIITCVSFTLKRNRSIPDAVHNSIYHISKFIWKISFLEILTLTMHNLIIKQEVYFFVIPVLSLIQEEQLGETELYNIIEPSPPSVHGQQLHSQYPIPILPINSTSRS